MYKYDRKLLELVRNAAQLQNFLLGTIIPVMFCLTGVNYRSDKESLWRRDTKERRNTKNVSLSLQRFQHFKGSRKTRGLRI